MAPVDAINTMRAILVGGAVLAGVVAAVFGYWLVVGLLAVGVAFHGLLWLHLHRRRAAVPPILGEGDPPR